MRTRTEQEATLSAIYDVYGLGEQVLGEAAGQLAKTLGIVWQEHDSRYRGRYFTASGQPVGAGSFVLQANDLPDGKGGAYFQLKDFPESRFLLFVNGCRHPDKIRARLAALPQWRFLRRRVLD